MQFDGVEFWKGHGTGNDFVLVPDPDGALTLSPRMVTALCDRHRGIGGDGVIRLVRSTASEDPAANGAEFFMDYINADGSLAQMCGNGARVFVHTLIALGLADESISEIATRGGVRAVQAWDGGREVAVQMGEPEVGEPAIEVKTETLPWQRARQVWMPNPHAVTWVSDPDAAGSLSDPPAVRPAEAFPAGVNVEFATWRAPDRLAMRVYERGVGETLSCGTGACAVAVAAAVDAGRPAGASYTVEVPGGELLVDWQPSGVTLRGPAELVARGRISPRWWEKHA